MLSRDDDEPTPPCSEWRPSLRASGRLSVLLAGLATLTCSPPPATRSEPAFGAILVSIDTLRADRLGCYGNHLPTSPHIDRFRQDAILFRTAIANGASTLISHASLFTSLAPPQHGASMRRRRALAPERLTVAEVLRGHGLATASFNGGAQLDPVFGVAQGFDVYEVGGGHDDTFEVVVDRAVRWLADHRERRFFLFLHTYEVHLPYRPSAEDLAALGPAYSGELPSTISLELVREINSGRRPLAPGDLEFIRRAYDAQIRSVDRAFGRLVDELEKKRLYDRVLLVLTSDHGEEFGEHGTVAHHSHTVFDELLRVPLLVKLPGSAHGGRTVDTMVAGVDLAPTIVAGLGFEQPPSFEGVDLVAVLEGRARGPEQVLSKVDGGATSVRTARWKWAQKRLYDLREDPGERTDVTSAHPERAAAMRRLKDELVARRPAKEADPVEVDEALRAKLLGLGYVE
jgi:arylsulfatase A-like enzyme